MEKNSQVKIFFFEFQKKNYATEDNEEFESRVNDFLESIEVKNVRSSISDKGVLIVVKW